jgi:hypothetical protein
MQVKITLRQLNPNFDKEYAQQYYNGKESDGNWKYNWSITAAASANISSYKKVDNTEFEFGTAVIKNVTVLEFITDNNVNDNLVISNKLIDKIHIAEREAYSTTHIYVYFKNTNEFYTIADKVYIACEDCPEELKKYIENN